MTTQHPKIIIDTREQRPWIFPDKIWTLKRKLETGDYSVDGLEDRICIERKSMNDLASTISTGRERFYKELERMQAIIECDGFKDGYAAIIVEGELSELLTGDYNNGMTPEALYGFILDIMTRLRIPVFFCGNRAAASSLALRLMLALHNQMRKTN